MTNLASYGYAVVAINLSWPVDDARAMGEREGRKMGEVEEGRKWAGSQDMITGNGEKNAERTFQLLQWVSCYDCVCPTAEIKSLCWGDNLILLMFRIPVNCLRFADIEFAVLFVGCA